MKISLLGTACCTFLLAFAPLSYADDERGRLADGRAYRTDNEGNQLVDYIAELELNIDTLNNQVRALEGDIEAKASLIEKLQRREPPRPLEEKTLVKTSDEVQQCRSEIKRLRDEQGSNQNQRVECDERMKEMKASIAKLNQEIEGRERKISLLETSFDGNKREKEHALSQCRREKEETSRVIAEKDRRIESLQGKLISVDLEMQSVSREKERLVTVVERESKRHDAETRRLTAELKRAQEEAGRKESVVQASLRPDFARPDFDTRAKAIDLIKGKTSNDLTTLRDMIKKRDELFTKVNSSNGSVKFTPTKAVTQDNQGLSTLEQRVAQARTVRELSLAMKDIETIRHKIADDLGVISRFNR